MPKATIKDDKTIEKAKEAFSEITPDVLEVLSQEDRDKLEAQIAKHNALIEEATDPDKLRNKAETCLSESDWRGAVECLEKAGSESDINQAATLLDYNGLHEESASLRIDKLSGINPADAWIAAKEKYVLDGNFHDAVKMGKNAGEDEAQLWAWAESKYASKKKFVEAEECAEKAIEAEGRKVTQRESQKLCEKYGDMAAAEKKRDQASKLYAKIETKTSQRKAANALLDAEVPWEASATEWLLKSGTITDMKSILSACSGDPGKVVEVLKRFEEAGDAAKRAYDMIGKALGWEPQLCAQWLIEYVGKNPVEEHAKAAEQLSQIARYREAAEECDEAAAAAGAGTADEATYQAKADSFRKIAKATEAVKRLNRK